MPAFASAFGGATCLVTPPARGRDPRRPPPDPANSPKCDQPSRGFLIVITSGLRPSVAVRCGIIKAGLLVLGVMTALSAVVRAEVKAPGDLSYLPETNPYRTLLLNLQSLPETDATALLAWGSGGLNGDPPADLPMALKPFVDRLAADMRATLSKKTQTRDWPLRGEKSATTSLRGMPFQPVRTLTRVLVRATDEMPAEQAVATWLALIQFGRNLSDERTLTSSMMAVVLENAAFEPMRIRNGELSADELLALARGKAALRPPRSLTDMFDAERELFFTPTVDQEYLPALRLLVDPKSKASAFDRVEVRGLMEQSGGQGKLLLKDRATGRTFTVSRAETVSGFELVSFDLKERTAVIRHTGREARVNLSNNKISVNRPELEPLRMLFWSLETGPGTDDDLQRLAEQVIKQGGPDSYIAHAKAEYARVLGEVLALASQPAEAAPDALPRSDSLMVDTVAKIFYKFARINTGCRVRDRLLDRAIEIRLAKSGATETTARVIDLRAEPGAPFAEETLADGTLRLTSRFESAAGVALRCEFPPRGNPEGIRLKSSQK